jgi:hypothetical protein
VEKQCEFCGAAFTCMSSGGCWCGAVSLTEAQLAWIKERAENCLCPKCLDGVAGQALRQVDADEVR